MKTRWKGARPGPVILDELADLAGWAAVPLPAAPLPFELDEIGWDLDEPTSLIPGTPPETWLYAEYLRVRERFLAETLLYGDPIAISRLRVAIILTRATTPPLQPPVIRWSPDARAHVAPRTASKQLGARPATRPENPQ